MHLVIAGNVSKTTGVLLKGHWRGDFPGGPVVKNPPANAGDAGSIPGRGTKTPYAAGPLSPRTTTTELAQLNKRAREPQTTEPTCPGAHEPQLEREKPTGHN